MFIISLQNNVLIFLFPQVWAQKDQSQEKNFKSIVWWNISFWGKKLTVEWKEIFLYKIYCGTPNDILRHLLYVDKGHLVVAPYDLQLLFISLL